MATASSSYHQRYATNRWKVTRHEVNHQYAYPWVVLRACWDRWSYVRGFDTHAEAMRAADWWARR